MADNEDPKNKIAPAPVAKPVEAKGDVATIKPKVAVADKVEEPKAVVAAPAAKAAEPIVPAKAEAAKPVEAKPVVEPKPIAEAKAAPAKTAAAPPVTASPPVPPKPVVAKATPAKAVAPKPKIKTAPAAPSKPKPVAAVVPVKAASVVTSPAKPVEAAPVTKVAQEIKDTVAAVPVPKAAKPDAAPKTAPKKVPGKPVFAGLFSNFMLEETTMDMSANFTGFQDAVTEAQAKAKAAFEKSTSVLGEVSDFAKGNVEAAVESGKIYAEGVQALGSEFVTESRAAFEKMSGDIKELAAAKSPTDFFKLQSDLVRKNFDTAVAYSSKNSEAMLKLMSDTFAPISGRVSIAVEKARSATSL